MQLTQNFSLAELTATASGLPNVPSTVELAALRALAQNVLQPLRDALGRPIRVTSGFRSAQVNRKVGGTPSSQHLLGQAADIRVDGMTSLQVARRVVALGLPFDQLIEEFGTWVHVSHGPRHRREQLTAVRRGGRTAYLAGIPAA